MRLYLPPSLLTLLRHRTNNCPECNLGKVCPFLTDNLIRYKIKQTPNINILQTQDLSYLENKTEFLCLVF